MIFINYRIADTRDIVARLEDSLREAFGDEYVFRDKSGIDGGATWPDVLKQHAEGCAAMLVVIGRAWQGPSFASGKLKGFPKLSDRGDWVRREIDIALKAAKPIIIPALVNGAQMPKKDWLATVGLEDLFNKQRIRVNTDTYVRDVLELKSLIQKVTPLCILPSHARGAESTWELGLGMEKLDQERMLVGCFE